MTPKVKSRELINTYLNITRKELDFYGYYYDIDLAIECSLVLVNEMIKASGSKYWYEVKKHLENL
jgi:hypothetical protein